MLWHTCKCIANTVLFHFLFFYFGVVRSINDLALHSIHDTKAFTAMASAQLVRAVQFVQSQELERREASVGKRLLSTIVNI